MWEAFAHRREFISGIPASTVNTQVISGPNERIGSNFTGQINTEWPQQFITTSNGSGTGDFTISVRSQDFSAGTLEHIFAQKNDAGGSPFTQVAFFANGSAGGGDQSGSFTFFTYPNSGSGADSIEVTSILDGQFHTWTGRRQGVVLTLFRDKVQVGQTTASAALNILQSPSRYTAVGSAGNSSTASHKGRVAFARAWNRALSDDEIRQHSDNPYQIFQNAKHLVTLAGGSSGASAGGSTSTVTLSRTGGGASGISNVSGGGSLYTVTLSRSGGGASASGSASAGGSTYTVTLSRTGGGASGVRNVSAGGSLSVVTLSNTGGGAYAPVVGGAKKGNRLNFPISLHL